MRKNILLKEKQVDQLVLQLKSAKSFIVFEYLGLTAHEITDIRKKFFLSKSKLLVVKNNILNRALQKMSISAFNELKGPNAIAYSLENPLTVLKDISELSVRFNFIKIKGSYFENTYLDVENTLKMAQFNNKEHLLSMLLYCLNGQMKNFLYALKTISETKQ